MAAADHPVERIRWRVGCPNEATCGWRGYRVRPSRRPRPCPACGIDSDKVEWLWQAGQGQPGTVKAYLLHFAWDQPGGARRLDRDHLQLPGGQVVYWPWNHYLGKAKDVPHRFRQHRLGLTPRGRVVHWAVAMGARLRLARIWDDPDYEGRHKYRGDRPSPQSRNGKRRGVDQGQARVCPICKQEDPLMAVTKPRRLALEALARHRPGTVRISNVGSNPAVGVVYWQAADWLIQQGYARSGRPQLVDGKPVAGDSSLAYDQLVLTAKGRQLCATLDLEVRTLD